MDAHIYKSYLRNWMNAVNEINEPDGIEQNNTTESIRETGTMPLQQPASDIH